MTQVILMLPECVAREAEAAGLLRPAALEKLLRAEIRRRGERPLVSADSPAEMLDASWQCFAMTFDHERDELTGWLNGVSDDRWLESPKKDKPLSVQVLAETAGERTELREYRYTKVQLPLTAARGWARHSCAHTATVLPKLPLRQPTIPGPPKTFTHACRKLHQKAEFYAATPSLGQRHPDAPEGWFYFRHKRWVVLYRPREHGIDVLRVVDAARDFPTLFS